MPNKKILLTATALFFLFNIVSAQSLKLWYNKPAGKWTEALPIGNGRIGAMVFGGIEKDRIQFNEETLWTGGPRNYNKEGAYQYLDSIRQLLFAAKQQAADALAEKEFMGLKSAEGQYQADYQPFGDLWLYCSNTSNAINYKRTLDIADAVTTTSYTVGAVDYKREYFICQPQQLLVVHLSANKKGNINFETSLSSPCRAASPAEVCRQRNKTGHAKRKKIYTGWQPAANAIKYQHHYKLYYRTMIACILKGQPSLSL